MVTISGVQLIVLHREDHGETLEILRNRTGSEPFRRGGMLTPDGEICHRRAGVAEPAPVAETAETAETGSRFVAER